MNLNFTFRTPEAESFFWHKERNGHMGGGFGNNKSYTGCQRAILHQITFPKYGMIIARQTYKRLRITTMKTYFKIIPKDFVYSHDAQNGITILKNGSFTLWLHLDTADEQDLRGVEPNSVLIDQAEEVKEELANVLDARVGRWDQAEVPEYLLLSKCPDNLRPELQRISDPKDRLAKIAEYSLWPKNQYGRFLVPNYFDCLTNPAEDFEYHWVYRYYYPESIEKKPNHFHISAQTWDASNDPASIAAIKTRDKEWQDRYYYGKVSAPRAIIHKVSENSIIDPDKLEKSEFDEFLKRFFKKAALYRVLDHGETGITCCGWQGTINGTHIFYREYYQQGEVISFHRREINGLSGDEEYSCDYADPQIFKKTTQKMGGFWSVADEYMDTDEIDAPIICWSPADNNEFATRNRINELLTVSPRFKHPVTGETPAPGIYFIIKGANYPYGISQILDQTKKQKRTLAGEINGKSIYLEERDKNIVDHGYDVLRYGIAMHNTGAAEERRKPPKRSFAYFNALLKRRSDFVPV